VGHGPPPLTGEDTFSRIILGHVYDLSAVDILNIVRKGSSRAAFG